MNTLPEASYRKAISHLNHAYHAMRTLMEASEDWTAVVEVQEEFRQLRNTCTEFAQCQHGIGVLHTTANK
jgi:hypothetical protein